MLKHTKIQSYLRILALLLGGLLLLAGCNTATPTPGEDAPSEEITTVPQDGQTEGTPTEAPTEAPDQVQDPTVSEAKRDPWPAVNPVAPPALVTERNVGLREDVSASGTLYNGDRYFYAVVLETSEGSILVQPYQGAEEHKISEQILIPTVNTVRDEYTVPAFDEGDLICVYYQGEVTPGSPAKIDTPARFEVLVKGFGSEITPHFCTGVIKAGYIQNGDIYTSPLNRAAKGSPNVFHITSVEELDQLLDLFVYPIYDNMWNEIQHRAQEEFLLSTYGEEYFAKNDLLFTYVVASSGSNRYLVWDVFIKNGMADITVALNLPEGGTCDMAGWFAFAEVAKDAMKDVQFYQVRNIDIQFGERQELPAAEEYHRLENAAEAFFGKKLNINQKESNVVYCGTYGDCNVITLVTSEAVQVTGFTLEGHKFSFGWAFEIWVERNGEFLSLHDAWKAGWLTELRLMHLAESWYGYLSRAQYTDGILTVKQPTLDFS